MRIALVAPHFRTCVAIAEQMAAHATVEVLATSADVGRDGRLAGDPGPDHSGAFGRRLFRPDHPGVPALEARLAEAVRAGDAPVELQERWLQERGPYSSALLEHLDRRSAEHDVVFFFTLVTATTVFGLPRVEAPVVLVPRLGDPQLVRFELLADTIARASGFVFASEDERAGLRSACGGTRPEAIARDPSAAPYLDVATRVRAVGR